MQFYYNLSAINLLVCFSHRTLSTWPHRLPGTEHLLNKYLKTIYVIVCLVPFSNLLSAPHLMCLVSFWSKINPSHSTLYVHQTSSWIRTPSRIFFSNINTKNSCASPKQLVCECTIICSTVNFETDCISLFALVLKEIRVKRVAYL